MTHRKTFFSQIKSVFLNGLFALLPITATIFFLNFSYTLVSRWVTPLQAYLPPQLKEIPGAGIILLIAFVFFVGIVLRVFVVGPLIERFEQLILRLPIVNTIYSAFKTLVDFFNVPDPTDIQRKVVLIEYPRPGYYNIAFLLGSAATDFEKLLDAKETETEQYFKVFMPNTPNPSSGYFFILPQSQIVETSITFEEAIKTIVSCGLISPESLKQK